jgi:hypothetical protein
MKGPGFLELFGFALALVVGYLCGLGHGFIAGLHWHDWAEEAWEGAREWGRRRAAR